MNVNKDNGTLWSRNEVSSCHCPEKSYRHVHCPCSNCSGRATDRSTERRHWVEASTVARADQIGVTSGGDETVAANGEVNNLIENDSEMEEAATCNLNLERQDENIADQDNISSSTSQHGEHATHDINRDDVCEENPLKKIIVDAVMNALRIMKESGTSIKTFEDILEYGKRLLFAGIDKDGKDIDRDVLLTLWPKNWTSIQKLLQEEGYEDAKEYSICFCREEKETTRNGKTTKKYVYSGKYSIMAKNDDLCYHCGNKGYLKYCYLGLKPKVKNWFRDKKMCKKMLSHWNERGHWLGRNQSYDNKREIWDGERWVELQWFWDPNSTWVLPTLCPSCGQWRR